MMWWILACNAPLGPHSPADHAIPPPSEADRPHNVVLIIGCTVRRDQTTPYGGPANTTPALDALAKRGMRMTDAIAAAPWTKPAAVAMLTGIEPAKLGMVEPRQGPNERTVPASAKLLAERFKDAGYRTIGVVGNPNVDASVGFAQGFDVYHDTKAFGDWHDSDIRGDQLVERATRNLGHSPGPFFLQLVLLDAHQPNTDSGPGYQIFESDSVPPMVRAYRSELRRMDDAIGTLLHTIEERGLTATTNVIFIADHGEGLRYPDHHGNGHGYYLYPSVLSIPWIAAGPDIGTGTVTGLASQFDLVPTLVSLMGLEPGPALSGTDLSPLWRQGGKLNRERVYASTFFQVADRAAFYTAEKACQVDFDKETTQKLIAHYRADPLRRKPAFPEGCFDRKSDVQHKRPTADPLAQNQLTRWHEAMLKSMPKRSDQTNPDRVPDAATQARLEALGYVDDPALE